jgi:hypothetical protein
MTPKRVYQFTKATAGTHGTLVLFVNGARFGKMNMHRHEAAP